jgi:hypothetical protein
MVPAAGGSTRDLSMEAAHRGVLLTICSVGEADYRAAHMSRTGTEEAIGLHYPLLPDRLYPGTAIVGLEWGLGAALLGRRPTVL